MAWTINEYIGSCKESYSLQVESDSIRGFLSVCLKMDGSVQVSYNDRNNSETMTLDVGEDGSSKILNKHSYHIQDEEYIDNYIMMGTVPSTIYENRGHLLEIGSGKILKAIYDFAINDIEAMEEDRKRTDALMSKYWHLLEENN